MERNKALSPVHIGFFGSDTIVHHPDAMLRPAQALLVGKTELLQALVSAEGSRK